MSKSLFVIFYSDSNRINGIGSNSTLSLSGLAYPSVGFYPPGRIQRISQECLLLASQPILFSTLYQLLKQDRIGEQDASSPRLTSLPLEKTVPAEDSRMALAFLTVRGSDSL